MLRKYVSNIQKIAIPVLTDGRKAHILEHFDKAFECVPMMRWPCTLARLGLVLVVRDLVQPRRLAQAHSQVHQHAPVIGTVPVGGAGGAGDDVTDANLLRDTALVAHPAAAGLDLEDLAVLVVVPVGAGTWEEGDMVAHDAVLRTGHFVHVDVASEGVGGFGGAGAVAWLGRVADDGAGHGGCCLES